MSESQSRLLADRIYEQLKADIIRCKYQPGVSLTEIEMANKFNVSRTPIREVCNRLLKEDLLHSIPYKGYIVSPINLQDLHELYQIRLVLEPYAAEMAARNPSPRFLEALRETLRTDETVFAVRRLHQLHRRRPGFSPAYRRRLRESSTDARHLRPPQPNRTPGVPDLRAVRTLRERRLRRPSRHRAGDRGPGPGGRQRDHDAAHRKLQRPSPAGFGQRTAGVTRGEEVVSSP